MKQLLSDLEGDKLNVLMLFLLYVLQGIPVGLYKSIPLILTNRGVPYTDQALFSIAYYPYSMKLLWLLSLILSTSKDLDAESHG